MLLKTQQQVLIDFQWLSHREELNCHCEICTIEASKSQEICLVAQGILDQEGNDE